MQNSKIIEIEWAVIEGRRARLAGSNARLGEHGDTIRQPILRLTDSDGVRGFGVCWADADQSQALLGQSLELLFSLDSGVPEVAQRFEFPIWDLVGNKTAQPVYRLTSAITGAAPPPSLRVPCYDTSLYFDDLHLDSTADAAALMASEAKQGYDAGHRAFKIKVGRGARHLPLIAGTHRDIAIIHAIRDQVGPECKLLIDANNGYNLNLTKEVLLETAGAGIYWLEEAFHEDAELYRDLRKWMGDQGLATLIADGEGDASPWLLNWAREGVVDIIQYDIFGYGLTKWLALGQTLDGWGARSAPHHYGQHLGNYAGCHLAAALSNFELVEWDEANTPGVDTSGYRIDEGFVVVPNTPGFGLSLDEAYFQNAVKENGFTLVA